MSKVYIAWRDIDDHEPRQSFKVLPEPGPENMPAREQTIPGQFGMKAIYIKWYAALVRGDVINLITYTHEPVAIGKAKRLMRAAHKFWLERN